jgi:hypothetical protein
MGGEGRGRTEGMMRIGLKFCAMAGVLLLTAMSGKPQIRTGLSLQRGTGISRRRLESANRCRTWISALLACIPIFLRTFRIRSRLITKIGEMMDANETAAQARRCRS